MHLLFSVVCTVFSDHRVDLTKPLITMCYNGHSATFLSFASALLGKLDTKVYYVSIQNKYCSLAFFSTRFLHRKDNSPKSKVHAEVLPRISYHCNLLLDQNVLKIFVHNNSCGVIS